MSINSNRRFFGKTRIDLSPITLGTMRFTPDKFRSQKHGLDLLNYLYDNGVDTYHTSSEYDAHNYFCDVFRKFRNQKLESNTSHIIKLACPHFEESNFSHSSFERKIEAQLQALSIERIDIVQWLFRQKNNIDSIRIPKLIDSIPFIEESFNILIQSGKVRAFAAFPYSSSFAEALGQQNIIDGFVDYLNIGERHWAKQLEKENMVNHGFVAIRPLCAGKIFGWNIQENKHCSQIIQRQIDRDGLAHWAISYPLLNPKVSSVILSISNIKQANVAAKVVASSLSTGNIQEFIDTTAVLDQIIEAS